MKREFPKPKHIVWIKYFKKPQKQIQFTSETPQKLINLFDFFNTNFVEEDKIYAQPSATDPGNENFLISIFQLNKKFSEKEIQLMNFIIENKKNLKTRSCKYSEITYNLAMQVLIHFFQLFSSYLQFSPNYPLSEYISLQDAISFYKEAFDMPDHYTSDIRDIIRPLVTRMPSSKSEPNYIFENDYFRQFEQEIFILTISQLNASASPSEFQQHVYSFAGRYIWVLSQIASSSLLNDAEYNNILKMCEIVSSSTKQFILAIPIAAHIFFIKSVLEILGNVPENCSETTINSVFQIGCLICSILEKFYPYEPETFDFLYENAYAFPLIYFAALSMSYFQKPLSLPKPQTYFSLITSHPPTDFTFELSSKETIGYSSTDLSESDLKEIQPIQYNLLEKNALKAINSIKKLYDFIKNPKLQQTFFTAVDQYLTKRLSKLSRQLSSQLFTLVQKDKNTQDGSNSTEEKEEIKIEQTEKNEQSSNKPNQKLVHYIFFIISFIYLNPSEAKHYVKDDYGLFFNKFIYDFDLDSVISDELHYLRTFVRDAVFHVLLVKFSLSTDSAIEITNNISTLFLGAPLHICDEIVRFLYSLFIHQRKRLVEVFPSTILAQNLIAYGNTILPLESVQYHGQIQRFLSFLVIFLQESSICEIFAKNEYFYPFLFHYIFDAEFYVQFITIIEQTLPLVSEVESIQHITNSIHKVLIYLKSNLESPRALEIIKSLYEALCRFENANPEKAECLIPLFIENEIIQDSCQFLTLFESTNITFETGISILSLLSFMICRNSQLYCTLGKGYGDIYESPLKCFEISPFITSSLQDKLIKVLFIMIFEQNISEKVITINEKGELLKCPDVIHIKNPYALILMHNILKNQSQYPSILLFLYRIIKEHPINITIISESNYAKYLIEYRTDKLKENKFARTPEINIIENILKLLFDSDCRPEYLLDLIGTTNENSEEDLSIVHRYSFITTILPNIQNNNTSQIVLSSFRSTIYSDWFFLPKDSKSISIVFNFYLNRDITTYVLLLLKNHKDEQILIFVDKKTLVYQVPTQKQVRTSFKMKENQWYTFALTIDINLTLYVNKTLICSTKSFFRFNNSQQIIFSLGSTLTPKAFSPISITYFTLFRDKLSNEEIENYSHAGAKELQEIDPSKCLIYITPFKYDKISHRLMNESEQSSVKFLRYNNAYFPSTQNIKTAYLHSNGFLRSLIKSNKEEDLLFILQYLTILLADIQFQKSFFNSLDPTILGQYFLHIDPKLITKSVINQLNTIWVSLQDKQAKIYFFSSVLFNFDIWKRISPELANQTLQTIHLKIIHRDTEIILNAFDSKRTLNTIIETQDNKEFRDYVWIILFTYLNQQVTDKDIQNILEFLKISPDDICIEFILYTFGFMKFAVPSFSPNLTKIHQLFYGSIQNAILYKFVYFLEKPELVEKIKPFISTNVWEATGKAFLSTCEDPFLLPITIATSSFIDQKLFKQYIAAVQGVIGRKQEVASAINDSSAVLFIFLGLMFSLYYNKDDNSSANTIAEFISSIIIYSFSDSQKSKAVHNIIWPLYMLSIETNQSYYDQTINMIKKVFKKVLDKINEYVLKDKSKKSNIFNSIDFNEFFFMYLDFVFNVPHSLSQAKTEEVINQDKKILSLSEMATTLGNSPIATLFPLSFGLRDKSDITILSQLIRVLLNANNSVFTTQIYEDTQVRHYMSYIFSIIAENDHNQIHEMILVFEKLFQPDNCDIATFSIFIYTIYNLCLNSDESEQNKKYVLSFAQNYSTFLDQDIQQAIQNCSTSEFFNPNSPYHYFIRNGKIEEIQREMIIKLSFYFKSRETPIHYKITQNTEKIHMITKTVFISLTEEQRKSYYYQALAFKQANSYRYQQEIENIQLFDQSIKNDYQNIYFDYSFKPIDLTPFSPPYQKCEQQIPQIIIPKEFIIAPCKVLTTKYKYLPEEKTNYLMENVEYDNLMFYCDNIVVIIGGLAIYWNNIHYIINKEESKRLEIYIENTIILIEFTSSQDESISLIERIKQFNQNKFIDAFNNQKIQTVYELIFQYNILIGNSFNDKENQPMFPFIISKIIDKEGNKQTEDIIVNDKTWPWERFVDFSTRNSKSPILTFENISKWCEKVFGGVDKQKLSQIQKQETIKSFGNVSVLIPQKEYRNLNTLFETREHRKQMKKTIKDLFMQEKCPIVGYQLGLQNMIKTSKGTFYIQNKLTNPTETYGFNTILSISPYIPTYQQLARPSKFFKLSNTIEPHTIRHFLLTTNEIRSFDVSEENKLLVALDYSSNIIVSNITNQSIISKFHFDYPFDCLILKNGQIAVLNANYDIPNYLKLTDSRQTKANSIRFCSINGIKKRDVTFSVLTNEEKRSLQDNNNKDKFLAKIDEQENVDSNSEDENPTNENQNSQKPETDQNGQQANISEVIQRKLQYPYVVFFSKIQLSSTQEFVILQIVVAGLWIQKTNNHKIKTMKSLFVIINPDTYEIVNTHVILDETITKVRYSEEHNTLLLLTKKGTILSIKVEFV